MEKRTVIFSEHKGFFCPTHESAEVIEEQKKLLGMQPRKTYEEAKRELVMKNSKSN